MKCKKHKFDFSSSIGVCASCLRERIVSIIAAQEQAEKQSPPRSSASNATAAGISTADDSPLPPPPLVFLRSVSPYDHRSKSDEDLWSDCDRDRNRGNRHQRFYSTPQIGPNCRTNNTANTTFVSTGGSFDRKRKSKFSLWSKLFRNRSEKFEKNHHKNPRDSSSSSPSWFSTIFHGRKIKQQQSIAAAGCCGERRKQSQAIERGMSPLTVSDSEEEEEETEGPISQKFHPSPMAAPRRLGQTQNVSGFAFCLSPLVRASPNRNWNLKTTPPEISFSGAVRVPANRSRKIADFGRVNHNR